MPLLARGEYGSLAGGRRLRGSRGLAEGRGHGLDGAGSRGFGAATAVVWALLVRRSSKLCASWRWGQGKASHFLPIFSSPA